MLGSENMMRELKAAREDTNTHLATGDSRREREREREPSDKRNTVDRRADQKYATRRTEWEGGKSGWIGDGDKEGRPRLRVATSVVRRR